MNINFDKTQIKSKVNSLLKSNVRKEFKQALIQGKAEKTMQ